MSKTGPRTLDDADLEIAGDQTMRGRVLLLILLVLGAGIAWWTYRYPAISFHDKGRSTTEFENDVWMQRIVLSVALVVAMVPRARKALAGIFRSIEKQSTGAGRWTAIGIFFFSGPMLLGLALAEGRELLPFGHDDCMYRLETTMLAQGKFCMPGLPLPDFFDVPYVIEQPVYGAIYFPGASLLDVPAVWMHLPYCVMPLLISATILTLLYLVISELIDGMSGLLAVATVMSLMVFRWVSIRELSHTAGLMWVLLTVWSWLRWRQRPSMRWVVLAGLSAGWYAITRPLDAVCVLGPISAVWAWDFRRLSMPTRLMAAAIVIVLAAPFLVLQLKFNHALTGNWLVAPLDVYNQKYFNARSIGLQHYDPAFVPPTKSLQIRDTYYIIDAGPMEDFTTVRAAMATWFNRRVPMSFEVATPSLFLIVLIPAGVMALRDIRHRLLFIIYATFMVGSGFFYMFHGQYVLAILPAILLLMLLGMKAIIRAFPAWPQLAVFLPTAILLLAGYRMISGNLGRFEYSSTNIMKVAYEKFATMSSPSLVLFRYRSGESSLEEPVYNWEVAWPDDALIVRAHDMGREKNVELFRHYRELGQNRTVYVCDRGVFTRLGMINDLAAK